MVLSEETFEYGMLDTEEKSFDIEIESSSAMLSQLIQWPVDYEKSTVGCRK